MDNDGRFALFIPTQADVKTLELRTFPRTIFNLKDKKMVTINVVNKLGGQREHFLRFRIYDISKQGLCLLVSNQNKNLISQSSELYVTQIGGIILSQPIKMERRHISEFRYKHLGKNIFSNKIGFQLEQLFNSEDLRSFCTAG